MDYYIDLLEPISDLNSALDTLGNAVGALYQKHWEEEQQKYYNKPFSLNVQAFAQLWFSGDMKIFVARNRSDNKPIGFIAGIVFRPMAYHANVFSVQDWYSGGSRELETALFDHTSKAIRVLNCDELWVAKPGAGDAPVVPDIWKKQQEFMTIRYTKE